MLAIGARVDELGFVDDPVDVAVLAREPQEGFERAALAVERIASHPLNAGATWSRTCADMSRTSAWNTASFESK